MSKYTGSASEKTFMGLNDFVIDDAFGGVSEAGVMNDVVNQIHTSNTPDPIPAITEVPDIADAIKLVEPKPEKSDSKKKKGRARRRMPYGFSKYYKAVQKGKFTIKEVCDKLDCSYAMYYKWVERYLERQKYGPDGTPVEKDTTEVTVEMPMISTDVIIPEHGIDGIFTTKDKEIVDDVKPNCEIANVAVESDTAVIQTITIPESTIEEIEEPEEESEVEYETEYCMNNIESEEQPTYNSLMQQMLDVSMEITRMQTLVRSSSDNIEELNTKLQEISANLQSDSICMLDVNKQNILYGRLNNIFDNFARLQLIASIYSERSAYYKYRQREGMAKAKEEGIHVGRPFIDVPDNFDKVYAEWKDKQITASDAMNKLGLASSTFYRMVHKYESENTHDQTAE